MKTVAIIGSLRKASYTRAIFNHYRSLLEMDEGQFADFPMYSEDLQALGFPESVKRLGEQVRGSNGVIIFSPEYNYSVPGGLKNALDWVSRLPNQPFDGKPVALVTSSISKLGGARVQYQFRQIGVFLNMKLLNRPEVMVAEAHKKVNESGMLHDTETKEFLKTHVQAFKAFVQGETAKKTSTK